MGNWDRKEKTANKVYITNSANAVATTQKHGETLGSGVEPTPWNYSHEVKELAYLYTNPLTGIDWGLMGEPGEVLILEYLSLSWTHVESLRWKAMPLEILQRTLKWVWLKDKGRAPYSFYICNPHNSFNTENLSTRDSILPLFASLLWPINFCLALSIGRLELRFAKTALHPKPTSPEEKRKCIQKWLCYA